MKTIDHADLLASPGTDIRLADFDPALTCDFKNKHDAQDKLVADIEHLAALQDVFYADGRRALLIIFQGMDAAGKDGAIKHVMSGVNPQGVQVESFKTPSTEELAHDYLWRASKVLPARGRMGIFNRSYYEEVGVVRVHTKLLENEKPFDEVVGADIWQERFQDIVAFERHLIRNGTVILKFFLNVSKDVQRKRLLERIDTRTKNWKISPADIRERKFWNEYQRVYGDLLTYTSTDAAPWYVIPADHKWFTRAAIADVIVAQLRELDLSYPAVSDEQSALLRQERKQLTHDDDESETPIMTSQHLEVQDSMRKLSSD